MNAAYLLCFVLIIIFKASISEGENHYPPYALPQNCPQAVRPWNNTEGLYQMAVQPSNPYEAYCIKDPKGGPMWTVIQRRMDGSENFYRTWTEYESGFGNKSGEYFLGLKNIYDLTNADKNELWIQLGDFDNEERYAMYGMFKISNAEQKYTLHVGNYSGTADDAMEYHNGYNFSTWDNDNDHDSTGGNCAEYFGGAWWFNHCHHSNLNGRYKDEKEQDHLGVTWKAWKDKHSFKYAHMAIRPMQYSFFKK